MTSQSLPQPQQTPEQLRWQSDYIQEYYYMVDGNRHSFSSFMTDMLEYPDFTVRQLLEYFSLEIADNRQQYEDEEED
tara:strand:- start:235 stop:465 length:231 start_codon:yes stop_codon:yes gene_type:complete